MGGGLKYKPSHPLVPFYWGIDYSLWVNTATYKATACGGDEHQLHSVDVSYRNTLSAPHA